MSVKRSSEIHSRPEGHSFMRHRAMQSCQAVAGPQTPASRRQGRRASWRSLQRASVPRLLL
eukprot:11860447-Alexandrium_andersonii.AAC.1